MDFQNTNLPISSQKQINFEFSESEKSRIKQQPIEIYINNLKNASDNDTISKMISYIEIILDDFKSYENKLKENIIKVLQQSEFVPLLLGLAKKQISPQLTLTITNILTGDSYIDNISGVIVQNGGIELFSEILDSNEELIRDAAIYGLGQIIKTNQIPKSKIVSSGALEKIIKIMKEQPKLQYSIIRLFSKLIQAIPRNDKEKIGLCFDSIFDLIRADFEFEIYMEVWDKICYTMQQLILSKPSLTKRIVKNNYINQLVEQFNHNSNILSILFLIIGLEVQIIISNKKSNKQYHKISIGIIKKILKTGFLWKVPQLFQSANRLIILKTLEILTSMTKYNKLSRNQILQNEEILHQIFILADSVEEDIVEKVIYILINLAENMKTTQFLMKKRLFRVYKTILERQVKIDLYNQDILDQSIVEILQRGQQLKETYYLNQLKELEIDKIIQSNSEQLDQDLKVRYAHFIDLK